MTAVQLVVNHQAVAVDIDPRTSLADLLREELRLTGTHLGCEHGVCGACTVLLDGEPVRSCIVLGVACEGRNVRTIEGFADDAVMAALREAFKREHGLQCGFCTPGMLIAARDIALRIGGADEARIRRELSGNLCRCTGYVGIVKAVRSVVSTQPAKPARAARAEPPAPAAAFRSGPAAPAEPSPASPVSVSSPNIEGARAGWTRFSESFVIEDDVDSVWKLLSDLPVVASCLPGAELTEYDNEHVKGRLTVKLGPIRAALAGSAVLTRDEASRSGRLRGAGTDRGSGSRTQATMTYTVGRNTSGAGARVGIDVEYNLQGPLAQFSRSGLAQEVGRLLVEQFAANLNRRLRSGEQSDRRAPAPLKVGGLVRALIARFLARLFRKPDD